MELYADTDEIKFDVYNVPVPVVRQNIIDMPAVEAVPVDIVAQMLCDAIGDPCACNVNGNDEWLPMVCDLQNECPYPKDGLGCWKQYIKHYGERRADNGNEADN